MTPTSLVAAALKSRKAFETIELAGEAEVLPEELIPVWKAIAKFYETDPESKQASLEAVTAYAVDGLANPKHIEHVERMVKRVADTEVSAANVSEMLRMAQKVRVQDKLAHALASRQDEETVEKLMEEWRKLQAPLGDDEEELDWATVVARRLDQSQRIPILPKALGDYLGGGVMPGHNIVIFARPEAGKTALCLTLATGFAQKGKRVLYIINEDAVQDLAVRAVCCMLQRTADDVRANLEASLQEAVRKGLGNIILRELAPGSLREIEAMVKRHKPDILIVDQLRNLKIAKTDNFTQGLDHNAQGMRALAKRYGIVSISTTQAGDSGNNKAVLDQGDIDSSNTGIPGAADALIGLGVNEQLRGLGQRVISLSKNKLSGRHGFFTVNINEAVSRVKSNG